MPQLEKNINKRALIYGVSIFGSYLIISAGLAIVEWHSDILGFFIGGIAGWAWWNFIHAYIFKGLSYGTQVSISLLIFFVTVAITILIGVFTGDQLLSLLGGHSNIHKTVTTMMILSGVYISVLEIGYYLFRK